jgi:hypothetical protein
MELKKEILINIMITVNGSAAITPNCPYNI